MHVSNSAISIFKDCPYKYYLSHILRLEPIRKAWALIDGEALHMALQSFYSHDLIQTANPSNLVKKCLEMGVEARFQSILSMVDTFYDNLSIDDPDQVDEHRHLTMAMVAGYSILYKSETLAEYRPELTGTIKIEADAEESVLEFRADALARYKPEDKWVLKEYKTSSEWSMPKFIERLLLDWQPTCYMYGFGKLGYDLAGVQYDIIRKPNIKHSNFESDDAFNMRRIKVMIADAKKGGQEYYHREYITRSPQDIKEFEEDLKRVIKDLSNHKEQELWYKNPARCSDYSGCQFKMLCWASDPQEKEDLINEFFKKRG